jgi:hypothetical protein
VEEIVILPFADDKLQDLIDILYVKEYFGFRADAKKYVDGIYNFIYTIPSQKHYRTKRNKYGAFYSRYKPNKNTTYYITFDTENNFYLVKNIITNHTREYNTYIIEG